MASISMKPVAVKYKMLADAVVTHGADAGICLDGDADRLVMVDGGKIGDQILGRLAWRFIKRTS